ncbi:MAG: hypothetical protein WCP96_03680 [Methylococcaceae bacterium]
MPETPPRATLGWSYSCLRQLLAIAASPESRVKNLKIEILLLLTALLRKLNRYPGLPVYLETLPDAGLLFFQQTNFGSTRYIKQRALIQTNKIIIYHY